MMFMGVEMKANEFVKKFGWGAAIEALSRGHNYLYYNPSEFIFGTILENITDDCFLINDLKRLVASHDLVESYGGLDQAKSKLEYFDWMPMGGSNHMLLSKAIIDVESCQ